MASSDHAPSSEMHIRLLDVLQTFRAHRAPVAPPPHGSYLAEADVSYLLMRLLDAMVEPAPDMLAAGASEVEFIGALPEEKARQVWTAMIKTALWPLAEAELTRVTNKSRAVSR